MLVVRAGKGKQPSLPDISVGESLFKIDAFDDSGDILIAITNKKLIDQDVPPPINLETN